MQHLDAAEGDVFLRLIPLLARYLVGASEIPKLEAISDFHHTRIPGTVGPERESDVPKVVRNRPGRRASNVNSNLPSPSTDSSLRSVGTCFVPLA